MVTRNANGHERQTDTTRSAMKLLPPISQNGWLPTSPS